MTEKTSPPRVSRRLNVLIHFAFSHVNVALLVTQGILLAPLYLSHMPVALYGAWLATGNILSWIELVDPGISAVLNQRVATCYGSGDLLRLRRVIGTGLALSFTLAGLPLLAWPFAPWLTSLVHVPVELQATLTTAFRIGLVGTVATFSSYAVTAVVVGLQLTFQSGVVYTSAAVIGVASTVAMLLSGVGLASIPLGLLARALVLFVGSSALVLRWSARHLPAGASLDRAELSGILGTSTYTFLSRVGVTLASRMDTFLSANLISPVQTTVLAFSGRPLDVSRIVAMSVGSSLQSGLAHLLGEGDRKRGAEVMEHAGRAVSLWTVATAGAYVALNQMLITLWVGARFYGGLRLTVLLAIATGLSIFTGSLNQLVFVANGIRVSAVMGFAEAVVKVTLQVLLVRRLGLIGMPLASIIASLAVPAWSLPRIAANLVGASPSRWTRMWVGQALRLGASIALGTLAAWLLRRHIEGWSWPGLLAMVVAVGTVFLGLCFASDGEARRILFARLRDRGASAKVTDQTPEASP